MQVVLELEKKRKAVTKGGFLIAGLSDCLNV
jgi:hypothetical protein